MNMTSLVGIVGSMGFLIAAVLYTAENPMSFMNLEGLMIVLGGCMAAVFASYPWAEIKGSVRQVFSLAKEKPLNVARDIEDIVVFSKLWRRGDIKGIERKLDSIDNAYLRTGIQFVIDESPLDEITTVLLWRIAQTQAKERADARVFHSLAVYAPAFGMVGTLVGLVNIMLVLEQRSFEVFGASLAIALVTTFYGLMLSNLIFKPLATKLERRTEQRLFLMNLVLEGVNLIGHRRRPGMIRETLKTLALHRQNELDERPEEDLDSTEVPGMNTI